MALLGFKKEFRNMILSGEKRQSIRRVGKRSFRVGERLAMYSGLRTKYCKRIGESKITAIKVLEFEKNGTLLLDGRILDRQSREDFAKADGFISFDNMIGWFEKEYGDEIYSERYFVIYWGEIS